MLSVSHWLQLPEVHPLTRAGTSERNDIKREKSLLISFFRVIPFTRSRVSEAAREHPNTIGDETDGPERVESTGQLFGRGGSFLLDAVRALLPGRVVTSDRHGWSVFSDSIHLFSSSTLPRKLLACHTSHFLYTGGFELDFFHDVLRIYAPVVYSSDFSSQLKTVPGQSGFFHTISFSIDAQNLPFRKWFGYTPF